jgi:hypothetical protein
VSSDAGERPAGQREQQPEQQPEPREPLDPVDLIAEAVLEVPGVHELHAGIMGEVATYLPGRRLNGLRVRDDGCEVHVVVGYGADIAETAEQVRTAVRSFVSGPVDVTIEDVAAPGAQLGADQGPA